MGIVILTGPPGAGKSTVAGALVEAAPAERIVHIHSDDFYGYIRKGYVEPWKPESHGQNTVVVEAMALAAERYADGGYLVLLDGIVGDWFLDPFKATGAALDYVVLIAPLAVVAERARTRAEAPVADYAPYEPLYQGFAGLPERHRIDSAEASPAALAQTILAGLAERRFRL